MSKISKSEAGRLGGIATRIKNKEHLAKIIQEYNQNPVRCVQCNNPILYNNRKNKFCSRSCAASYNNKKYVKRKRERKYCKSCNTILKSGQQNFCSTKCYGVYYTKYDEETRIKVTKQQRRIHKANYRARLVAQIPPDADLKAIAEFYRNCPKGYEVDHIIPISKGGLHTLENLQYLTKSENCSKGAKLNWKPKDDNANSRE